MSARTANTTVRQVDSPRLAPVLFHLSLTWAPYHLTIYFIANLISLCYYHLQYIGEMERKRKVDGLLLLKNMMTK